MLTKLNFLLAVVVLLTLGSELRAAIEKPAADGAGGELQRTIKSGTKMLKDGKTDEFIERFMMPDDLQKLKQSGHFDEIKQGFKEKSGVLIKLLEAIQDADPKLSDDGATATYSVPKIEGAPPTKEFHFKKIKDKWYIGEH